MLSDKETQLELLQRAKITALAKRHLACRDRIAELKSMQSATRIPQMRILLETYDNDCHLTAVINKYEREGKLREHLRILAMWAAVNDRRYTENGVFYF